MSLANKLTEERRHRLAAERLLELKQAELFAANRKLGRHAQQLTEEIVETRAVVETIRGENQRVKIDLCAAHEKIQIAERRLWHSIEAIKDGFAFFNADNELIAANRAYLAIFDGLELVRPGINYITILQLMTDEGIVNHGSMPAAAWRQMMTERIQQHEPEPIVIRLWNNGFIKLIDRRGPDGDLVSLGLDITETVRYQKDLKEARSIAEAANRAKSAFLANMSHEIRTPMNGVVGMAQVLADTDLSAEQHLYVDTIRHSGEALLAIINDVLDYSKIEARKLDLHPETFDLERLIQQSLMLLQPTAHGKRLMLLMDYDPALPARMIGDPGRIRQVLTNLIGNAVKFTNKGHVLVRVAGHQDKERGIVAVQITIEDTGIGIPANMIDHIFGEFNQVENQRNRQYDGTGLGLPISQRLIVMMGGQIRVTSQEGLGSSFSFQIDLAACDQAEPDLPTVSADIKHVMVVDDSALSRTIIERQLRHLRIEVTCCATIAEARDRLHAGIGLVFINNDALKENDQTLSQESLGVPIVMIGSMTGRSADIADRSEATLQTPYTRRDLMVHLQTHTPIAKRGVPIQHKSGLRPMRILAAEDNTTNQLVFRKMIKALHVDLRFADNGRDAVTLFQSFNPDLIFMDISMPGMDGKAATRAIRALEPDAGPKVTIVALTAHAMDSNDDDILNCGIDHFLTKPLRKPAIIDRIQQTTTTEMHPLFVPDEDQVAG